MIDHKEMIICSICNGAFDIYTVELMGGQLYCPQCLAEVLDEEPPLTIRSLDDI